MDFRYIRPADFAAWEERHPHAAADLTHISLEGEYEALLVEYKYLATRKVLVTEESEKRYKWISSRLAELRIVLNKE